MRYGIRETEGVSWIAAPGVRRWRSRSVYFGGWLWLLWYGLVIPFLWWPVWLTIEFYVIIGSAVAVTAAMVAAHQMLPVKGAWRHTFWYFRLARLSWTAGR